MHTLTLPCVGDHQPQQKLCAFFAPAGAYSILLRVVSCCFAGLPDVHASTILAHAKPLRACTRASLHVPVGWV